MAEEIPMINPEINQPIFDLWNDVINENNGRYPDVQLPTAPNDDNLTLAPRFYEAPQGDTDILFIGLNPSFSVQGPNGWHIVFRRAQVDGNNVVGFFQNNNPNGLQDIHELFEVAWNQLVAEEQNEVEDIINAFFSWDNVCNANGEPNNVNINQIVATEQFARIYNNISFNHMREINQNIGGNTVWREIDLFVFRKTQQGDAKDLINNNEHFRNTQIEIFQNLLVQYKPKVIVIANKYAKEKFVEYILNDNDVRNINGNLIAENNDFFDANGFYNINLKERKCPVLCTSLFGRAKIESNTLQHFKFLCKKAYEWYNANNP